MNFLNSPKKRLICIIITFILAFVSSAVINVVRGHYYSTFVSCEGVVTDIEWFDDHPEKYARIINHRHSVGSSSNFRTYYSFTVDEKTYESSFLSSEHVSKYRVGDSITIWYDPKNPSNSRGYVPSPGLEVIVPYFLAAPVIVGIATYGKSKKRALFQE